MKEYKQLWDDTCEHLANKFGITTHELIDIFCYCYSDTIKEFIIEKKYLVLLELTRRRSEVERSIRRTLPKLKNLESLKKKRKKYSELDLDFIEDSGYNTGLTKIDGVWKQSHTIKREE